jgi:hypothetical protein
MLKTSETTAKLDAALAKAQGEIEAAAKDAINPHFNKKYADLSSVWAAIRPSLSKHGISVTQWPIHSEDNRLHMVTRLAHDGEYLMAQFSVPVEKQNAHGYGSATTYAKRYCLAAAVGVVADEDDDGNEATKRAPAHDRAPHIKSPPPKLSVHAEREHSVPDTADISGTKGAPKNEAAKKLYETLIVQMRQAQSIEGLKTWLKLCRTEIETLPDEYMAYFDEAYENHRDSLTARAA